MSKKNSHFTDVMYKIIRVSIIVGILATITGYYIDVSQRDTIVIQGISERSSESDAASSLFSDQAAISSVQQTEPVPEESAVYTAPGTETAPAEEIPQQTSAVTLPVPDDVPAETTAATEPSAAIDIQELQNKLAEPDSDSGSSLLNINTASAVQLMELDGIGEVKAAAIVEYRREHGIFKSIDELVNVKGIGEKTLEKNRDKITV